MKNNSPAWPFLTVLACLFVLCISTPRAWERIGRQGTLNKRLATVKREHESALAAKAETARLAAPPEPEVITPPAAANFAQPVLSVAALNDNDPLLLDGDPTADCGEPATAGSKLFAAAPSFNAGLFVAGPGYAILEAAPAFGRQVGSGLLDLANGPLPAAIERALLPPPAPAWTDAATNASIAQQQAIFPGSVFEQLKRLEEQPLAQAWAHGVQHDLRGLSSGDGDDAARMFTKLAARLADAERLSAETNDLALQSQLLRARYAIERRLPLWRRAMEASVPPADADDDRAAAAGIDRDMTRALAQLQTFDAARRDGVTWRDQLELDRVGRVARDPQAKFVRERLARRVLDRLSLARQTPEHRRQLSDPRVEAYAGVLERWVASPPAPRQLLATLETYERLGHATDAKALSGAMRALSVSSDEVDRRLAADLNKYYANANFRMAISGELANRLMPRPEPMKMPINETLGGLPVQGSGAAWTELRVVLIPDAQRVRLGLEGAGVMRSDTLSASGPAKFRNNSTATYTMRKLFVLGPGGLRSWPAIAEAHNRPASLAGMETDYDRIPLVNTVVRNIARSKYEEAAQNAVGEADVKLANRVRQQFDTEAGARLIEAQAQYAHRLAAPFERLGVDVTPVSFSTTEDRLTMRYRLAATNQLGANTPRPRAPSDSLLSMQLHESAINNMLSRLDLDGRRFTLPELYQFLSEKLSRPELKTPEDLKEEIVLTFASENPIQIQLQQDRLDLRLAFAELTVGQSRWRNFTVRARYAIRVDGLDANLQRESGIFLEGPTMRGKPELVLRGVFGRALSQSRRIPLSFEKLAKDPRLADLMVSQAMIEDGWLSLAYGPRRADREAFRRDVSGPSR